MTDANLLKRIKQGDEAAWSAFLERYTDLIYAKACQYARQQPDRHDEIAELYLFMAQSVRRSLPNFAGRCKASTWIISVIGNRKHVLKAFLLHQRPDTAELRLPKILRGAPSSDQEIFKRLVWGLEPVNIAQDLNLPPSRCYQIEDLLAEHSPRVWHRIRANRQRLAPHISLDQETEIALPDSGLDPAAQLERQLGRRQLEIGLNKGFDQLQGPQRRVLLLLYNHRLSIGDIVERARTDPHLGLGPQIDANRVYYLKDRGLAKIIDAIIEQMGPSAEPPPKRTLLKKLDELLKQWGLSPRSTAKAGGDP